MGDLALPSICHMAAWVGERCPPHINPEDERVQKVPLLSPGCNTWESRPCTNSGTNKQYNQNSVLVGSR